MYFPTVSEKGKLSIYLHPRDSYLFRFEVYSQQVTYHPKKGKHRSKSCPVLECPFILWNMISPSLCIMNTQLGQKLELYKELSLPHTYEAIKWTDKLKSYSYRNTLKAIVKEVIHQFAKLVKGIIFYYTSYIFLIYIFLTSNRINA